MHVLAAIELHSRLPVLVYDMSSSVPAVQITNKDDFRLRLGALVAGIHRCYGKGRPS